MLQIIVFCHAELVSASNLLDLETLKRVQGDNFGCFETSCYGLVESRPARLLHIGILIKWWLIRKEGLIGFEKIFNC